MLNNSLKLNAAVMFIVMMAISAASPATSCAADKTVVQVLAGAGLKDALYAVKDAYTKKAPGVEIRFSLAAAGILQKQVEEGVPADLFFTPGKSQMDDLQRKGLIIPETRIDLLGNEIVLVVATEKKGAIKSFGDLPDKAQSVSIGLPEIVPAGKYARETLKNLGLWDKVEKRILFAKDVRTVLAYVDSGNVDAGLVYRSDTAAMKSGTLVAVAPKGSHSPIRFTMAVLTASRHREETMKFMEFLKSPEAAGIFARYRFTPLFGARQ
jgi:molybdate transport system substrate-binding protein